MRIQTTALTPRDGLLTLSGYGIRMSVERRHLLVSDGVGRDRRLGALHRATTKLARLVVLGHGGFVTLEALRWLADVGAAFVQIDGDGRLIACFAPEGTRDVRLRRAQALAASSNTGLAIVRDLLQQKLEGQRVTLLAIPGSESARAEIVDAGARLAASSMDELRWHESVAASAYWNLLARVSVQFARADLGRVPAHWRTVGPRSSALTGVPRSAITPGHALLNYAYATLESEARIAALTAGLDPEMGLLHALRRFRNSFAHDLMEPLRPAVDAYVLDMLASRTFAAADFVEARSGSCRLVPDLARLVANTGPLWRGRLASLVRHVADQLATAEHRRAERRPMARTGRAGSLRRLTPPSGRPKAPTLPVARCRSCGIPLREKRLKYCPDCAAIQRQEAAPQLQLAGPAAIAVLRREGRDPTHGGAARAKRSAKVSMRHAESRAWPRSRQQAACDREEFRTRVLPLLRDLSLHQLMDATGLSRPQCSMIKRGMRTPHPRHWAALAALIERAA